MMSRKTRHGRVFVGVFFLLAAVILGASKMGWLTYQANFWTIIATIVLAGFTIKGLFFFDAPIVIFSLAFMSMLYAGPLGITRLVPWTVLGIALLASIGLSMILLPIRRRIHHRHLVAIQARWRSEHNTTTKTEDQADVYVNVRLGNAIRYVKSDDFHQANINLRMAEAKVYFDEAKVTGDQALIIINGSMSSVELYLPKEWRLESSLDTYMGTLSETGATPTKTGPTVQLAGEFRLGDVKVHYV